MKETNLNKVKETAKALFMVVPIKAGQISYLIQHPYTNYSYIVSEEKDEKTPKVLSLYEEDGYEKFKSQVFKNIDGAKDVFSIIMLLTKSYYMTFFKFTKDYLSDEDYAKVLSHAYTIEEWPNADVNIKRRELISYFKKVNKELLMDKDELNTYEKLREQVRAGKTLYLYRGVSYSGKPDGISWTFDKEKAKWFAKRFYSNTSKARLYTMTIKNPESILAVFTGRNESEVIVDTIKEHDWVCQKL